MHFATFVLGVFAGMVLMYLLTSRYKNKSRVAEIFFEENND
jgi:hypothetical protein